MNINNDYIGEGFIHIGKITSAAGIKGEVKAFLYSGNSRNIREGITLYTKENNQKKEYTVENVRDQNRVFVIKLEGIDDRNASEGMRNIPLFISESDLQKLPEGTHYVKDMIGMKVFDRKSNKVIGKIVNVLQETPQSIYIIEGKEAKEILIPSVDEFVKKIDMEKNIMEVELIDGFIN